MYKLRSKQKVNQWSIMNSMNLVPDQEKSWNSEYHLSFIT